MCKTRTWKTIEPFIFDDSVNIVSTRSDNLIITVQIVFEKNITTHQMVKRVSDGMKHLETYRNCKCSVNETCEKHKNINNKTRSTIRNGTQQSVKY